MVSRWASDVAVAATWNHYEFTKWSNVDCHSHYHYATAATAAHKAKFIGKVCEIRLAICNCSREDIVVLLEHNYILDKSITIRCQISAPSKAQWLVYIVWMLCAGGRKFHFQPLHQWWVGPFGNISLIRNARTNDMKFICSPITITTRCSFLFSAWMNFGIEWHRFDVYSYACGTTVSMTNRTQNHK